MIKENRHKNSTNLIPGLRGVMEAVSQGEIRVTELWAVRGKDSPLKKEVISLAEKKRIPVYYKESAILDEILPGTAHQGIVAITENFQYAGLEQIIKKSFTGSGSSLLLALDHITDEGNLGAVIRSAAFFGVQGLILPKDRSASVTPRVMKNSSGGYAHVPVSLVVNLGRILDDLAEKGFWIIGAAGEGRETVYSFDWKRDTVLILGNEEKGISPGIRKRCHELVNIPASGSIEALNVSVAAGVILSEISRQRACK